MHWRFRTLEQSVFTGREPELRQRFFGYRSSLGPLPGWWSEVVVGGKAPDVHRPVARGEVGLATGRHSGAGHSKRSRTGSLGGQLRWRVAANQEMIVKNESGSPSSRQLVLTLAEALVLSDWLDRLEKSENASCDGAERAVLARIGAQLDEQLEELFAPNYKKLVAKAKEELISRNVDSA